MRHKTIRIGLISDTHDLVRPQAKRALAGVERILHAGDICDSHVLDELREIAPVLAVRGNNDRGGWARSVRLTETISIAGIAIHMLHDLSELELDPQTAGFHVVISGHSHRPLIERKGGVLFVNPGSAGPRRFKFPISIGLLEIERSRVEARLLTLQP